MDSDSIFPLSRFEEGDSRFPVNPTVLFAPPNQTGCCNPCWSAVTLPGRVIVSHSTHPFAASYSQHHDDHDDLDHDDDDDDDNDDDDEDGDGEVPV